MSKKTPKLLDTIALTKPIVEQNLLRGQVGAVVEVFADGWFEVEFVDKKGQTLAMLPVHESQLMVLEFEMAAAA